jgi:hypothetical protein
MAANARALPQARVIEVPSARTVTDRNYCSRNYILKLGFARKLVPKLIKAQQLIIYSDVGLVAMRC